MHNEKNEIVNLGGKPEIARIYKVSRSIVLVGLIEHAKHYKILEKHELRPVRITFIFNPPCTTKIRPEIINLDFPIAPVW